MIFWETKRLRLRSVCDADAVIMHDYRNNAICARYQRGQTKDLAGIKELVQAHAGDRITTEHPFMVAITTATDDELVGEIVVMPNDNTFTLGYTISYRHHRKGYAFEALSALIDMLHEAYPSWEFICFTDPENIASRNLLKKLGYTDLGYLPSRESQIFGKWLHPASLEEIAQAIKAKEKPG